MVPSAAIIAERTRSRIDIQKARFGVTTGPNASKARHMLPRSPATSRRVLARLLLSTQSRQTRGPISTTLHVSVHPSSNDQGPSRRYVTPGGGPLRTTTAWRFLPPNADTNRPRTVRVCRRVEPRTLPWVLPQHIDTAPACSSFEGCRTSASLRTLLVVDRPDEEHTGSDSGTGRRPQRCSGTSSP